MLDKTNWTTRTDLTMHEINALVRVRERLELNEINVDMSDCYNCIGAHMARALGRNPMQYVQYDHGVYNGKFRPLFYPNVGGNEKQCSSTDTWEAAQAITNFLNGSDLPWA